MAVKQITFQEKKSKGDIGEIIISLLLQAAGWYVIPNYDYCGKEGNRAPQLQSWKEDLVTPDLDIAKGGKRQWVEVKTKEGPNWTIITGQLEHGIPFRHYESYLKVQEVTGCVVWLFIYEKKTRDILFARMDSLNGRRYKGNKMSRGGMIFFPRDAFERWMRLPTSYVSKREMERLVKEHPCHFSNP